MFRTFVAAAVVCATLLASSVSAQEVERAPVPAWVKPPLQDAPSAPLGDAAFRVQVIDNQIRFDAEGSHTYVFQRFEVLTRQGLSSAGTVSLVWTPPRETIQVHLLRIVRNGEVIDVLASQEFETLRRENNLEAAMLDGQLTATLQPRDLRVGDVLELAFTTHDTLGVLAPHVEAFASPSAERLDRYRLRASWSDDHPVQVAAAAPWTDIRPRREGGDWVYEIDATDLRAESIPEDLPVRFALKRFVEFTDYASWADASRMMAPLYARGATLEPDSPLRAEIERIRAAHSTDAARAGAALRLVEDQVRYLALSMGEGNYTPMSADEVWRRRYGDCKGKTVLLMALLEGLGIKAEALLVSTRWGDGLETRLPLMAWFDHVIVHAVVDGKSYWMDGTRIGDRRIEDLTPPPYRWGLPVRAEGASLEAIPQPPLNTPLTEMRLSVDASAGLDADVGMVMEMISRGDVATSMRRQVGSIPPEQLEAMFKAQFDGEEGMTIDTVETRYDEAANELRMILTGKTRMSWVNGPSGRVTSIDESVLVVPASAERRGVLALFRDHPYAISHPFMNRAVFRVTLPHGGRGFQLEGGDQTVEGGGYRLERRAVLNDGVAEVEITTTSLVPELSAAEMATARTRAESTASLPLRLRAPANYVATEQDSARYQPRDSDIDDLITRAGRLSDMGDTDGALALLDAALEREPDHAEARRARGSARIDARDYDGARADYDHAADLDPADQLAATGQGIAAYYQGRYSEAVVNLSVALRLDPSDTSALSTRAAAYYQLGRWDRSLADYRTLKTTAPDSVAGPFGELRALIRLERPEEARGLISARLTRDPADYVGLERLVRIETQAGTPEEALPALDRAIEGSPEAVDHLALRGQVRALTGDETGAREDFAVIRQTDPSDPDVRNTVCWAQALAGFDLEQALIDCDAALSAGEAAYVDSRAMVLLQMERYAEAKADYERALSIAPDLAPSLYGLGLSRLALGDAGGAEDLTRARARDVDVAEDFAVFEARHPELVK
ncbi:tetratricopeptide repeat protein [Brevundimonas sp. GCM10030266]|uniref:tetratricopeptide repeat protein n=1 Tax=Brevundimonas sp. GCM10030266 TaxID=3273386 RepID=UPI00361DCCBA